MKIPNFLTKEENEAIFLIKNCINYAAAIARERGVDTSSQFIALHKMEKKGLIKSKQEKLFNKVIYTLIEGVVK